MPPSWRACPSAPRLRRRHAGSTRKPCRSRPAATSSCSASRRRPGPRPAPFNARSQRVTAYRAHLRQTHASIAKQYGAEAVTNFTAATNGFVADLTKQQALDLATDRRVLLVEKSQTLKLDTWNTPDFLGLTGKNGAWTTHGGAEEAGDGMVVADLDSGIWPESKSFAGEPLTETPKTKWDISRTGTRPAWRRATAASSTASA